MKSATEYYPRTYTKESQIKEVPIFNISEIEKIPLSKRFIKSYKELPYPFYNILKNCNDLTEGIDYSEFIYVPKYIDITKIKKAGDI